MLASASSSARRSDVVRGVCGSVDGGGAFEEELAGEIEDLRVHAELWQSGGGVVDDGDLVVGKIELDVDGFAGELCAVEGGVGVVVVGEDLPLGGGPRGLRHPEHAAAVGIPEVRVEAFEDGAMADVVEHLRFAIEVGER